MPTIKYPKNPNVETAFVEQDGGTKNRVVLTAPQDISTIEYPNNPNSTKAYVTVNGKKQRVVMTADIAGGGGSVDYSKTVQKTDTMPVASADNENQAFMYTGATNANYTTNYIYRNIKTSTYTSTVTFEAATLSSSTIACSGSDFAAFVAEWGSGDITTITNGTITYDQSGGLLVFVGKDADSTTVCTFLLYTQDYQDAGFTITGTLQDGDVFAFTCSISEASATYAWIRVDVQPAPVIPDPLPSQTGNAGKFLSTDGTNASWSDKPLVNNSPTGSWRLAVGTSASAAQNGATAFGVGAQANSSTSIAIGRRSTTGATAQGNYSIAIGGSTGAIRAIQIGDNTNNDANTFKVANANGNFEIMSDDGTIPTARLTNAINKYSTMPTAASTNEGWIVQFTGTTDANYTHGYIYECKAQGTNPETYAWEAVEVQASSGGGLPSQTGNAGKFLITDGTDASWSDKPLVNNATVNSSISIGGETNGYTEGVAIGVNSMHRGSCVAIGYNTQIEARNVAIGHHASAKTSYGGSVAIGNGANANISPDGWYASIAIGPDAVASADGAIQICSVNLFNYSANKTNNDANTFKVANNNGNFELMNANGNLPADRLASTTGLADGNYRLRLTMASGVPTLSWVAE